jgi:hypothetical protein
MNVDKSTDWRQLYKEALLEPNPEKLLARIAEAHYAMQCRARELWYEGSSVTSEQYQSATSEQYQMDTACEFLELLATMVVGDGNEHTHRHVAYPVFGRGES